MPTWKGIGIYHLTLTIPTRAPLLGTLVIPDDDPRRATVRPTELGRALLDCQRSVPLFHPEIQILQYSLMPDHLHTIWYVRRPMEKSISYVAQGFWRAAKKAGRAYSYLNARLAGEQTNERVEAISGRAAVALGGEATVALGGETAVSATWRCYMLRTLPPSMCAMSW